MQSNYDKQYMKYINEITKNILTLMINIIAYINEQ